MTNLVTYKPAAKRIVLGAKPPARLPAKVIPAKSGKPVAVTNVRNKADNKALTTVSPQVYKLPALHVLDDMYEGLSVDERPLYDSMCQMHYVLGAMFESQTVSGTIPYPSNMYKDYKEWIPESAIALSRPDRNIDVANTYVETKVDSLKSFKVRLNLGDSDKTALNSAVSFIKVYLPNFELPTTVETIVSKDAESLAETSSRVLVGLKGDSYITLDKLAALHPNYVPKERWTGPKYPEPTDKYKELVKKARAPDICGFKLRVATEYAYLEYDNKWVKDKIDLTVQGPRRTIVFDIECTGIFHWPLDFALYITSASSPNDFYPALFIQYLNEHRKAYVKNMGKKRMSAKAPARINHYGHIKKMIEAEGLRSKITVNEDNFLILGSSEANYAGKVVWIPQADKVDDYLTYLKNSYDAPNKVVTLSKANAIKNVGLFTDHNSEKFSYLNAEGNIDVFDLTGSVPLDNMTIRRDLLKPINNEESKAFFEELDRAVLQLAHNWLATEAEKLGTEFSRVFLYYPTIYKLYNRLIGGTAEVTWNELGSGVSGDQYKIENMICGLMAKASQYVLDNFDKIDIAYSTKILYLRYHLVLVTKYSDKMKEFNTEFKDTIVRNQASNVDLDSKKVKITNMPGLTYLLPHQVKATNKLVPDPFSIVIDISVGGGKTALLIADLAKMLASGKIKRALIICPNKLVRSWVTEINKFSEGELNPFPITREGTRRLNAIVNPKRAATHPDLELKALKGLFDKSPINTVFVVGLSFLSRGSSVQKILYGSKVIDRYKLAEFIKDCGFDWVGIDESQKVKNLSAGQTQAASIIITGAKYKRLASGTIVNNTPTDLVGQTSMLNPAIFGRTQEFRDNYTRNPAIASSPLRPGAAAEMAQAMIPYTSRFTAKKRDWAFALPKFSTYFHTVNLTEHQRIYYEAQVKQVLTYLLNDPKIQAILSDPDPEKAAAAAKFLTVHFQKVEQFLCAPDSVALFAGQAGLTDEDLISPKVAAVEQILKTHFDELKDPFKVLIFSYRKVTPQHIYDNLSPRWQKMAKVYTAGGKDGMGPVTDFMKNDKVKILIANEGSIKEGFNLQCASRLIKLETVWAPGDQEQAIGRIYRPSDTYKRANIYLDYVLINDTLEVAKFARLISKQIDKMRYDEEDNPEFTKKNYGDRALPVADQIADLELIKMSLENIKAYSNVKSVQSYITNFQLIENWEEDQFDKLRNKKLGTVKIDDANRQTIPGSKNLFKMNSWMPRVEGVDPINADILQPISVVESRLVSEAETARDKNKAVDEDGEDEEDVEVEVNPVKVGQIVDTEFGLGWVKKINKNDITVDIPGIIVPVKVPKSTTYVYINAEAEQEARARLKRAGRKGLARLPGMVIDQSVPENPITPKAPAAPNKPQPLPPNKLTPTKQNKKDVENPVIKPTEKKFVKDSDGDKVNVSEDDAVDVMIDIINGSIVLMIEEADVDSEVLLAQGFKVLPQYILTTIHKADAIPALWKALEAKGFTVGNSRKKEFAEFGKFLQQKKLNTLTPEYYNEVMHYLRVKFNPLKDENAANFYPLVTFSHTHNRYQLHAAANLKQQPKFRKLLGKTLLDASLASKFVKDGPFIMKAFKDKVHALNGLAAINKILQVYDYQDLVKRIKQMKVA